MPIRAKKKINGKWQPSGSYLVDVVTKTVGRIVKATGIFPTTKNAREKLEQVKLMLKDLDINRDEQRLTQIKLGKVKLLDALAAYQSGRVSAIEAYAGDTLLPSMLKWLQTYTSSPYTLDQYTEFIKRLQRLSLITPSTRVRELPDVMRALKAKMNREGKAVYFRAMRQMFISYAKTGLGYDADSTILKELKKISLIPVRSRREHHPFAHFYELIELGRRINSSGRWGNRTVDYRSWVFFMTLTGIRPTEFERGAWERDAKTGHIRIKGTKTVNANRVVPNIIWLSADSRRLANLQMRLINLDPPTPIRCRDFRRSAALFYEAAGIPRSRYSYYLGHGHRDITGIYERHTPTVAQLDADRAKLLKWIDEQRHNKPIKQARVWSPTAKAFLEELYEE
jgi:hypothetical protein